MLGPWGQLTVGTFPWGQSGCVGPCHHLMWGQHSGTRQSQMWPLGEEQRFWSSEAAGEASTHPPPDDTTLHLSTV